MNIYFHIKLIGVLFIILAIIHIVFPKYFHWKEELSRLSLVNKEMMVIHTFFIALVVFLMGLLCVISTKDLVETNLGKTISFGLGIFWGIRLVIQFFGYSSQLWKGKTFETAVHIVFSVFWFYITTIFFLNFFIST